MRSSNDIFGTKLLYPQWLCLDSDARRYLRRSSAMDFLERVAGPIRMIQLRRRDQVRQAVSLVLAQQTGIWSTRAGDPPSAAQSPTYDRRAIVAAYEAVRWQDAGWQELLALMKTPVLRLDYEDLAADPAATLRLVLSFLDLPAPPELPLPRLRPQAGPLSETWVAQARNDLHGRHQ
jgi:LPS sulfotransferase NodH